MPPLRRQSISVLGHDETGRAEATQSQARNAHRPPKMNEAEPATHPTAYFPTRPTCPTPPRRNRARSTAPRQRNRALPAGQGGVGFPEKPSAVFHVEGETRKRPTQQDATQGLNGRSTIRLPGHRRHAHHFTRQTATRADPRTKSQAARATFPRTQALSISTARPRQHSQHFEHQAFPASPTRPQAARRRHAR